MTVPETLSILSWKVQSPGQYGGSADLEVLADRPREYFLTPSMTDHRPVSATSRL
jgi:hypothetical protein